MRKQWLVAVLLLGGLALSACGTSPRASLSIHSSNCTVTATNSDLAGCNLSNKDLSGVDMQGDNLRGTNLSKANLDGANIQGAKVSGAQVVGVITNDRTVCVNAEPGPCKESGLRSFSEADATQGH
jgi:uncharacterized protein YjbI with pentapeptide repeats